MRRGAAHDLDVAGLFERPKRRDEVTVDRSEQRAQPLQAITPVCRERDERFIVGPRERRDRLVARREPLLEVGLELGGERP